MTDQNSSDTTPPSYDPSQVTPPPAAYGAAPAYGGAPAAVDPGKTLGIVAIISVFFISILGLILGYVARSQSKKAGFANTPAKVAIILGWIFLALSIITTIILIVVLVTAGAGALSELCDGMPAGEYELNTGGTIVCP